LLTAHGLLRNHSIEVAVAKMPRALLVGLWTVMVCGIILTQGNGNAFIYFQF
jgi:alginate O-acetyltransferase complex protein AlgI